MNQLEAVVFDMDGLLLDTEPLHQAAWDAAATTLGFSLDPALNRSLIGKSELASLQLLQREFGDSFAPRQFMTLCGQHWEAHIAVHGIAMKPGAVALLQLLESEAIPAAIATSSHQHNASLSLQCVGLAERFDIVVTGDQIAHGKPAPDIYLEAARRLAVDPSSCLAFEDSEPGLMAATAAGMDTFLVPDINSPSQAAIARAARVLPSLEAAHEIVCSLMQTRKSTPR